MPDTNAAQHPHIYRAIAKRGWFDVIGQVVTTAAFQYRPNEQELSVVKSVNCTSERCDARLNTCFGEFVLETERVCAEFGITRPQYNVLRILRGVHPDGHTRGEIAARLLASAPDVTRLVDRLEAQCLVERERVKEDRRLSIARITKKGLRLLEEVHPHIAQEHKRFSHKVSPQDCSELSRICETIYDEE